MSRRRGTGFLQKGQRKGLSFSLCGLLDKVGYSLTVRLDCPLPTTPLPAQYLRTVNAANVPPHRS